MVIIHTPSFPKHHYFNHFINNTIEFGELTIIKQCTQINYGPYVTPIIPIPVAADQFYFLLIQMLLHLDMLLDQMTCTERNHYILYNFVKVLSINFYPLGITLGLKLPSLLIQSLLCIIYAAINHTIINYIKLHHPHRKSWLGMLIHSPFQLQILLIYPSSSHL